MQPGPLPSKLLHGLTVVTSKDFIVIFNRFKQFAPCRNMPPADGSICADGQQHVPGSLTINAWRPEPD